MMALSIAIRHSVMADTSYRPASALGCEDLTAVAGNRRVSFGRPMPAVLCAEQDSDPKMNTRSDGCVLTLKIWLETFFS